MGFVISDDVLSSVNSLASFRSNSRGSWYALSLEVHPLITYIIDFGPGAVVSPLEAVIDREKQGRALKKKMKKILSLFHDLDTRTETHPHSIFFGAQKVRRVDASSSVPRTGMG